MSLEYIKQILKECCNDILFVHNDLESGITSEVHAGFPIYQIWHGDNTKECFTVDDVITTKFFGGKSIVDLLDRVEFTLA